MTTQQIQHALVSKRRELNSSHMNLEDIAVERQAEQLDEIQQAADRAMALDSMTRKSATSFLIAEALERIDRGTYGICLECDEPISDKRVAAVPWAKYCLACQEAADQVNRESSWDRAA